MLVSLVVYVLSLVAEEIASSKILKSDSSKRSTLSEKFSKNAFRAVSILSGQSECEGNESSVLLKNSVPKVLSFGLFSYKEINFIT